MYKRIKIILLIALILQNINILGQAQDTLVLSEPFSFKETNSGRVKMKIEGTIAAYIDYIERRHKATAYVVKFIEIKPNRLTLSMTYFFDILNYSVGPFQYYTEIHGKHVLLFSSETIEQEYVDLMASFGYSAFSRKVYELLPFPDRGLTLTDSYENAVAFFNRDTLILRVRNERDTPMKYWPQSDEYIKNYKNYSSYWDKLSVNTPLYFSKDTLIEEVVVRKYDFNEFPQFDANQRMLIIKGIELFQNFIEIENAIVCPAGYVVKLYYLTEERLVFSIGYYFEEEELNKYNPDYYGQLNDKPILFLSSEKIASQAQGFFTKNWIKFDKNIRDRLRFSENSLSKDIQYRYECIAKYEKGILSLKIHLTQEIPKEFRPQSDEFLKKN